MARKRTKADPRPICTSGDVWTPEKGKYGIHPDAHQVGEQEDGWPGGDIVRMRCPNCGVRWTEELPQ